MKCPKCNYTSFDYLDNCKKCDKDLIEHREKHNIRSVLFASSVASTSVITEADVTEEEDFEFDFNEDEQAAAQTVDTPAPTPKPNDDPFGVGEESDDFNFDSDDTFSFDDDEL